MKVIFQNTSLVFRTNNIETVELLTTDAFVSNGAWSKTTGEALYTSNSAFKRSNVFSLEGVTDMKVKPKSLISSAATQFALIVFYASDDSFVGCYGTITEGTTITGGTELDVLSIKETLGLTTATKVAFCSGADPNLNGTYIKYTRELS